MDFNNRCNFTNDYYGNIFDSRINCWICHSIIISCYILHSLYELGIYEVFCKLMNMIILFLMIQKLYDIDISIILLFTISLYYLLKLSKICNHKKNIDLINLKKRLIYTIIRCIP